MSSLHKGLSLSSEGSVEALGTVGSAWFTEDGELAHAEVGRLLGVGRVDLRGQDGA